MKRWFARGLAALLTMAASPGVAQDGESRARLDDFTIVSGDGSLRMEQIAPGRQALEPSQRPQDRIIASHPRGDRTSLRSHQISAGEPTVVANQLSGGANPTRPIPTAGTTATDSRPRGVIRIAGSDRCDPQLPERDLVRCLQILELRAQEFSAPAPPQLSAEQSLLAGQQSDEESSKARSSQTRLRLATLQDPDADLDSNQELASIYLTDPAAASTAPAPGEPPEEAAQLADIITAIMQGSPLPTPD